MIFLFVFFLLEPGSGMRLLDFVTRTDFSDLREGIGRHAANWRGTRRCDYCNP